MSASCAVGGGRRGLRFASVGALAFAVAQGLLWRLAGTLLNDGPGWFLNSGRNVAAVAAVLAGVALATALSTGDAVQAALMVAVGAVLAMIITLIAIGPGNLFPIVIVIGATVIIAAVVAGTLFGMGINRVAGRR